MIKTFFFFLFTSQLLFSQLNINHNVVFNYCDEDLDGIVLLDLRHESLLITTDQNLIVNFFYTSSDAQNNIGEIPSQYFYTGSRILYARVVQQSTGIVDFAQFQINVLNCTMNTIENTKQKSAVFPIPATDFINIKSEEKLFLKVIYSLEGKKVKEFFQNKISISELKPGIYFLKINKEKSSEIIKFIKQ
jgi:hypothetical protein